ncbi:MAG: MbnP family protein [Bacteroidota bacterium]
MKNAIYFLLLSLLFVTACDDDNDVAADTTDMQLTFKATYNDQPLVMQETYTYGEMSIRFSRFDFYIADLSLTKDDASGRGELALKEIDYVDLSYDQTQDAMDGYTIDLLEVPTGAYTGFKLGVGVPPDLNKTEWTDYATGHPLNNANHYWKGWNSFIFSKIEGIVDVDNDGNFDQSFTFHSGRDTTYFDHGLLTGIELQTGSVPIFGINIELSDLFKVSGGSCDDNGDGLVDLDSDECSRAHSNDAELETVIRIMRNFGDAFTVNK